MADWRLHPRGPAGRTENRGVGTRHGRNLDRPARTAGTAGELPQRTAPAPPARRREPGGPAQHRRRPRPQPGGAEDPGPAPRPQDLTRQPREGPREHGEGSRPAPGNSRLPPAPRPRRAARTVRARCGLQGGLLHGGRQPPAQRLGRQLPAAGHRRRRHHRLRRPHRGSRPPDHGRPRQPQDPAGLHPRRRRHHRCPCSRARPGRHRTVLRPRPGPAPRTPPLLTPGAPR